VCLGGQPVDLIAVHVRLYVLLSSIFKINASSRDINYHTPRRTILKGPVGVLRCPAAAFGETLCPRSTHAVGRSVFIATQLPGSALIMSLTTFAEACRDVGT